MASDSQQVGPSGLTYPLRRIVALTDQGTTLCVGATDPREAAREETFLAAVKGQTWDRVETPEKLRDLLLEIAGREEVLVSRREGIFRLEGRQWIEVSLPFWAIGTGGQLSLGYLLAQPKRLWEQEDGSRRMQVVQRAIQAASLRLDCGGSVHRAGEFVS
jgi:hypothetical protein